MPIRIRSIYFNWSGSTFIFLYIMRRKKWQFKIKADERYKQKEDLKHCLSNSTACQNPCATILSSGYSTLSQKHSESLHKNRACDGYRADATIYVWHLCPYLFTIVHNPDIYRYICSYRDRLGFYTQFQNIFGTVYCSRHDFYAQIQNIFRTE